MGETSPALDSANKIKLTDLEAAEAPEDWLTNEEVDVREYLEINLNQLNDTFYNKEEKGYPCSLERYKSNKKLYMRSQLFYKCFNCFSQPICEASLYIHKPKRYN